MGIQPLANLDFVCGDESRKKTLNVCVVSFFGTARSGGVGTATSALIRHLAADGHSVTLLYTLVERGAPINIPETETGDNGTWSYWVDKFNAEGIALKFIAHQGGHDDWLHKSWLVKEFIGQSDFDLVYFDDWYGMGYYSLLAKQAGLTPYASQLHCVITHATKQWICETNDDYFDRPAVLEQVNLERRSVEMADVVIAPSRYILRQYQSYGWRLPERSYSQPLPLRTTIENDFGKIPINEIVFFGRLELRKGLWLFCEAIDRIAGKLSEKTVSFLGPATDSHGISTGMQAIARSANWSFRVRLLSDFDSEQAIAYLKQGNKLAVMPSLADNSPCVIYECMEAGIPFVITRGSGSEEILHPECRPQLTVEPNALALAERLEEILAVGARLGRPSFEAGENLRIWSAWHRHLAVNHAKMITEIRNSNGSDVASDTDSTVLVIVDDGKSLLRPLIENLISHTKRFGRKANYIILSTRAAALTAALSDLFKGFSNANVQIFGAGQIKEAKKVIFESRFAFFMDPDVEILTPFFILGRDALAKDNSRVVTCVGGVHSEQSRDIRIEELPVGNLPGLPVFGHSIGGPVWAICPDAQTTNFSQLELYDSQVDSFIAASKLGELFMYRCRLADVSVHLIPIMGALTKYEGSQNGRAKAMADTRSYTHALGIMPSLSGGAAAWFALSAFAPGLEKSDDDAFAAVPSPALPIRSTDEKLETKDYSFLAAALGRTELALQMEASGGTSAERVQRVLNIAAESERRHASLDLAELLAAGTSRGAASVTQNDLMLSDSESGQNPPQEWIITYADPRLQIERRNVRTKQSLRSGGPGKVFFFDVPLSGQSNIEINLRSSTPDPIFFRLRVIDQFAGEEIGVRSTRLSRGQPGELTIPLYELHGWATVVLEFSGVDKMDINIKSLLIH
jgi:glycosyltransferase involved in cell wall biosynthesis